MERTRELNTHTYMYVVKHILEYVKTLPKIEYMYYLILLDFTLEVVTIVSMFFHFGPFGSGRKTQNY